jgi:hypothetical protein
MNENKCSVCGKKAPEIKLFIEVDLEIYPKYVKPDGSLENMNGLWKKTRETFCEGCFDKYTAILESFYKNNKLK